jgi:hypothetical protein
MAWLSHLTLAPAQVLSIAEVLSDWLLLFYVMGESEGNLRVFGQCEVEERAQSL